MVEGTNVTLPNYEEVNVSFIKLQKRKRMMLKERREMKGTMHRGKQESFRGTKKISVFQKTDLGLFDVLLHNTIFHLVTE